MKLANTLDLRSNAVRLVGSSPTTPTKNLNPTKRNCMNEIIREILIITQEEAAEVIQEISKVQRFGLDTTHKSGKTNQAALEQEIGDFLAMVDLLLKNNIITEAGLAAASASKIAKLHQWSNIFGETKQYNA